ncbi:MAG: DUF1858 domain-containing protein [Pseudomonadota bacterium]
MMPVSSDILIDELMVIYKLTIPVFIRHKMMCIGCPFWQIHDVRDACLEHGIPLEDFLADLEAAIAPQECAT